MVAPPLPSPNTTFRFCIRIQNFTVVFGEGVRRTGGASCAAQFAFALLVRRDYLLAGFLLGLDKLDESVFVFLLPIDFLLIVSTFVF